jgi:hypothetical protein
MRGTPFRAYSREFCKNLVSFFGFMLESSIFSHLRWSAHHAQTNGLSHIIEELLPKCEDDPLFN